jgi:succinate dehydrogenase / fumarate reductase, cytochrome b subunit
MPSAAVESKTSYILDKLHSLSGLVPIGAFLAEHFFENSYALVSPDKFNWIAAKLETIPWRVPVEFLFIWAPILYHGIYGLFIWWKGKSNALGHPWMANWMYVLQRWTGIVAFLFIFWHVWTERFVTHGISSYDDVARTMSNPWVAAFYIAGILCASFHLGNGLWNFCCKWGIAVTPRSQRMAAIFGAAVAVTFSIVGLAIIAGFHFTWTPFHNYIS